MDTPKKEEAPKGINWLAILGIFALCILIVVVIWAMNLKNQADDNPLIQAAVKMGPWLTEMEDLTQSQIDDRAAHMTAEVLAHDPFGYIDRYVVLEGEVSAEESNNVNSNIVGSCFADTDYKAYVLDQSVVLVDITGESVEVKDGTVIRGYGKVFVVRLQDVWDLPIVGPDLEREFAGVEGMDDKAIFHLSKGIEIISIPEKIEDEPLPGELGSDARTPTFDEDGEGEAVEGEPIVDGEEDATDEEAPIEDETPVEDEAVDEAEEPAEKG